jgi:hypothetical protein
MKPVDNDPSVFFMLVKQQRAIFVLQKIEAFCSPLNTDIINEQ